MLGFMMLVLDDCLDYVLDFMNIDSKIGGRRFWRFPKLYVKAWFLRRFLRQA
jgi:hypothetical protein